METPVTVAAMDESEQRCDAVVWAAAGCAAAACAATARRGSWARSLPAWLLLSLKVELRCRANDAVEMPAMTPEMLRTLCCLRSWLEDDSMRGSCCLPAVTTKLGGDDDYAARPRRLPDPRRTSDRCCCCSDIYQRLIMMMLLMLMRVLAML